MSPFVLQLPSDWTFFGLTYEYNQKVYDQIFELVYYGQGGFTYDDVYSMPVNLRAYYYVRLADILETQQHELEIAKQKQGRWR